MAGNFFKNIISYAIKTVVQQQKPQPQPIVQTQTQAQEQTGSDAAKSSTDATNTAVKNTISTVQSAFDSIKDNVDENGSYSTYQAYESTHDIFSQIDSQKENKKLSEEEFDKVMSGELKTDDELALNFIALASEDGEKEAISKYDIDKQLEQFDSYEYLEAYDELINNGYSDSQVAELFSDESLYEIKSIIDNLALQDEPDSDVDNTDSDFNNEIFQEQNKELAEKYLDKPLEECNEEELNKAYAISLIDSSEAMQKMFNNQNENDGVISGAFDWAKELTGLGVSSEDAQEAIDNQNQMINELKASLSGESDESFEETYKKWTGVDFDINKIIDYQEKTTQIQLAQATIQKSQDMVKSLQNAQTTGEMLDIYTQYYGSEKDAKEAFEDLIKFSCDTNPVLGFDCVENVRIDDENNIFITQSGEEFQYLNLEDINIDSWLRNSLYNSKIEETYQDEAIKKFEQATGIDYQALEDDFINSRQEAIGDGDKLSNVVNKYCESQEGFIDKLACTAQIGGMGLMVAGGVLCFTGVGAGVGATVMGIGSKAAVAGIFADNAMEFVDTVTSKDNTNIDRYKDIAKETFVDAALYFSGQAINGVSGSVNELIATQTGSKLLATMSEVGVDGTLSLMSDLIITGDIDLKGEGLSQILGVITGVANAKINATKTDFNKAGEYFSKGDIDGGEKYLKDLGYSESMIDKSYKVKSPSGTYAKAEDIKTAKQVFGEYQYNQSIINNSLRKGIDITKIFDDDYGRSVEFFINKGFDLLSTPFEADTTLYRQVVFTDSFNPNWKVGDQFMDLGFTSTSTKSNNAFFDINIPKMLKYQQDCNLIEPKVANIEILAPKGTRAIIGDDLASEALLKNGTIFNIVGYDSNTNTYKFEIASNETKGKFKDVQKPQTSAPKPDVSPASYFSGDTLPKNKSVLIAGTEILKLSDYSLDLTEPTIKAQLDKMNIGDIKTVGRDGDIKIDASNHVSRKHLQIKKVQNGYEVVDMSTNGTKVVNNKLNNASEYYNGKSLSELNPEEVFNGKPVPNIHPDELVRYKGNNGSSIDENYVRTSREARAYLYDAIERGVYTDSLDSYIDTINDAHIISYKGFDGESEWYGKVGEGKNGGSLKDTAGVIRRENLANGRYDNAKQVEQIAIQYGDSYRVAQSSRVMLEGIPYEALPFDTYRLNPRTGTYEYRHFYPEASSIEDCYYKEMHRTAKETLDLIGANASDNEILTKIAQHYQYAANARPYDQINNSLFINEANALLTKAGLNPIPHGILDHAAQRLQPDTFAQYFIDYYYQNNLGVPNKNIA